MPPDPHRLGRIGGMLEVLGMMATELAGTEAFTFSVAALNGESLENAYRAYVGSEARAHPLHWRTSDWPSLRWTIGEWSQGLSPYFPAARTGQSCPEPPASTCGATSLAMCAQETAHEVCEAIVKLVGLDAELGVFVAEHEDGSMWRLSLEEGMAFDCIIRSPRARIVLSFGCTD